MTKTMQTRKLVFSAMCVAIGIVLPIAFHTIPNAGAVLLPMHLPVLLCGLTCGWPLGLACGVITPLLSSLLTGMPPAARLPAMLCELAAYGLISGLLRGWNPLKRPVANVYCRLAAAMLIGRAVYGILNALVFSVGRYSLQIFLSAAFVTAAPGIVIQLALLPPLIVVLERFRLMPGGLERV